MLHDSDTAAIETCQTKIINCINVVWRDCVSGVELLRVFGTKFGTTLARRLNQSRASAVLHSNLIAIKFGTAEARRLFLSN